MKFYEVKETIILRGCGAESFNAAYKPRSAGLVQPPLIGCGCSESLDVFKIFFRKRRVAAAAVTLYLVTVKFIAQ